MQERRVSVAEVESIIEEPDGQVPQSQDKKIVYKKLRGRKDNLVAAVIVGDSPAKHVEVVTVLVNFEVRR